MVATSRTAMPKGIKRFADYVGLNFLEPKKKEVKKEVNHEFVNYVDSKKLQEFNRYLNHISKYFNNPLNELLKQQGMLLELYYTGKHNKEEKQLLRRDIERINKRIDEILKNG